MVWLKLFQLHLLLLGLAAFFSRWTKPFFLARLISPVIVVLGFFFIEHFAGLGTLGGVGFLASAAAAAVLIRQRKQLTLNHDFEIGYTVLFAYTFLWRYAFPDLHGDNSERLMNLSFILNYSRGTRLPPVDSWFPPLPFGMYYAIQHYAAALLGRLLGVEPGVAYHLAFATLIALAGGASFVVIRHFTTRHWQAWLIFSVLFVGGTGASLPVHFLEQQVQIADSMAFIGQTVNARRMDTPLGQWLLEAANIPRELPLQLPLHTPSFLIQLGDYHAPLGSLFLLTASLACMVLMEKERNQYAAGFLGASVPLTAVSNAWVLPLQSFLVAGWLLYRRWLRRPLEFRALVLGGVAVTLAASPFLAAFLGSTSGTNITLKLVQDGLHTPLLVGLILWLPILLITAAQLGQMGGLPFGKVWTVFFCLCFLFSEFIYANDHYMRNWERFNSTLKWWMWIWVGMILTAAPGALQARSRVLRWIGLLGVLLPLTYVYDLARYYALVPKPTLGMMNGAGALEQDAVYGAALAYLRARPDGGTMLQLVESDAYTLTPSLAILAGRNAFLGWPEHERVWRGGRLDIYRRETEARQFYLGVLPDPLKWLQDNGITDVFWLPTVHTLPAQAFPFVFESLRNSPYVWKELHRDTRGVYGVWSLRP